MEIWLRVCDHGLKASLWLLLKTFPESCTSVNTDNMKKLKLSGFTSSALLLCMWLIIYCCWLCLGFGHDGCLKRSSEPLGGSLNTSVFVAVFIPADQSSTLVLGFLFLALFCPYLRLWCCCSQQLDTPASERTEPEAESLRFHFL